MPCLPFHCSIAGAEYSVPFGGSGAVRTCRAAVHSRPELFVVMQYSPRESVASGWHWKQKPMLPSGLLTNETCGVQPTKAPGMARTWSSSCCIGCGRPGDGGGGVPPSPAAAAATVAAASRNMLSSAAIATKLPSTQGVAAVESGVQSAVLVSAIFPVTT